MKKRVNRHCSTALNRKEEGGREREDVVIGYSKADEGEAGLRDRIGSGCKLDAQHLVAQGRRRQALFLATGTYINTM